MFNHSKAFSSFAVKDAAQARAFYQDKLELKVTDVAGMEGIQELHTGNGITILLYPKPDHTPATYTVLNFPVTDIEATVAELNKRGITMLQYTGDIQTDARGITINGKPRVAWFTDPFGNILSVLQE